MKLCSLLFFLLLSLFVYAQSLTPELVSSGGDDFTGSSVVLSWSLGEVAVETYENMSGKLTEGFHQPFYTDDYEVQERSGKNITIKLFPNPVESICYLDIAMQEHKTPEVKVFDLLGKEKTVKVKWILLGDFYRGTVNLEELRSNIYLLNIQIGDSKPYTFRLLKI